VSHNAGPYAGNDGHASHRGPRSRLCAQAAPALLTSLADAVERAEAALARASLTTAAYWNARFHVQLRQALAGRPRLAGQLTALEQQLAPYRAAPVPPASVSRRRAVQHRQLLAALEFRDPEMCERLMRHHGGGVEALACLGPAVWQPARPAAGGARDG